MQTADESGQLSGLTQQPDRLSSGSQSQDGNSSMLTERDVDERPIGACYVEMTSLLNAIRELEAADATAKNALQNYWACRDQTAMAAASSDVVPMDIMAQAWRIFDERQKLFEALKSQLELETPE